jgi:DNA phosphorothioation-dependent restriction protein DptG
MYSGYVLPSNCIGFKVSIEGLIVNAPLVSLQSKNTNNAKREVRFKQLIRDVIRGGFTIASSTSITINLNEQNKVTILVQTVVYQNEILKWQNRSP